MGYFEQALSDFTFDLSSGGAIRHLCDLGYSVSRIRDELTYPTPFSKVQACVWAYLLDQGAILLEEPKDERVSKYTYIREYDAYGKASFRRVLKDTEEKRFDPSKYVRCDFGRWIRENTPEWRECLEHLEEEDQAYLLEIPWPSSPIYHIKNPRLERIQTGMKSFFENKTQT